MFFSKDTIVAFAAGSATVALCSWAYTKYRHTFSAAKFKDAGCQTLGKSIRNKGVQTPILKKANVAVMARPMTREFAINTMRVRSLATGTQTRDKKMADAATSPMPKIRLDSRQSSTDSFCSCLSTQEDVSCPTNASTNEELIVEASQRYVEESGAEPATAATQEPRSSPAQEASNIKSQAILDTAIHANVDDCPFA